MNWHLEQRNSYSKLQYYYCKKKLKQNWKCRFEPKKDRILMSRPKGAATITEQTTWSSQRPCSLLQSTLPLIKRHLNACLSSPTLHVQPLTAFEVVAMHGVCDDATLRLVIPRTLGWCGPGPCGRSKEAMSDLCRGDVGLPVYPVLKRTGSM